MAYLDLLVQRCNVQRESVTYGSRGQATVTWANVETNIKCNVQMETISREELMGKIGGERSRASFIGFFEYGKDIQEGDKVIMTDSGDSREFHVDKVSLDSVGHRHHIEADLEII